MNSLMMIAKLSLPTLGGVYSSCREAKLVSKDLFFSLDFLVLGVFLDFFL